MGYWDFWDWRLADLINNPAEKEIQNPPAGRQVSKSEIIKIKILAICALEN